MSSVARLASSARSVAASLLATSAIASFIGGIIACVMVVLLAQAAASFALKFGPAEMFSLILFAMTAAITLAEGKLLRGAVSLLVGLVIPALFTDFDGRGLHDRVTGTAVVRR